MRTMTALLATLGLVLGLQFTSTPSQAQATRTWVSGVGDDANPCSRTAPCRTFAGAISKTAAKGAINTLDPGAFGAVTITKAITIRSDGMEAGVLAAGTNGIIVNVGANDSVVLEGLDIDGAGTGLSGVNMLGDGRVTIRRCVIRNFTGNGVRLAGLKNALVFIEDSFINNNGTGVFIQGIGGVANHAILRNTVVDKHTTAALTVFAPSNLVLIGTMLSASPSSIVNNGGAEVISYGNNVIRNSGAPTVVLPLK